MISQIVVIALATVVAIVACHGHGGGDSSGSWEHSGKNCTIVASGTTNCTGATGHNCSDSAYLASLLPATTTVLFCKGRSQVPQNGTIEVELGNDLDDCRGRCNCFLVPAAETRNCAALNADAAFVKTGCNNQTALIPLVTAATMKVCVFRGNRLTFEGSVKVYASLEKTHGFGHH